MIPRLFLVLNVLLSVELKFKVKFRKKNLEQKYLLKSVSIYFMGITTRSDYLQTKLCVCQPVAEGD